MGAQSAPANLARIDPGDGHDLAAIVGSLIDELDVGLGVSAIALSAVN